MAHLSTTIPSTEVDNDEVGSADMGKEGGEGIRKRNVDKKER